MLNKTFYRTALLIGAGSAFSMLGDSTVYTVLPLHIEAAGITLTSAGVLMGVNRLVRIFSNSISGYIFDFGSKRELLAGSLILGAFSTLFFAFFTGFWPLFISRVLWGFAWSGISIGGIGILFAQADIKSRGKWIGLLFLWMLAGNALGAVLGGFLSDLLGYRGAMAINGSISMAAAVIVYIFLPQINENTVKSSYGRKMISEFSFKKTLSHDKKLYLAAVVIFVTRFVFSGFLVSLLSMITREKISPWIAVVGISTLTGLISGSKSVVSMITAPLAGIISDKIVNKWKAVFISLLIGSFGVLMVTFRMPLFTIAGLLICAVPGTSISVLSRTLAGDLAEPERQGRSVGFVLTAGDLGSAVGPPAAFLVLHYTGLDLIFRVLAMLLLMTAAAVRYFTRTGKGTFEGAGSFNSKA